MRNLAELQMTGCLPAPANQDIVRFQQEFDVLLPEDYLDFLRECNGGYTHVNRFDYGENGGSGVNQFFHLTENIDDGYSVFPNTAGLRELPGKFHDEPDLENALLSLLDWSGLVAIAENGGGDIIALDFTSSPPSVRYVCLDPFSAPKVANSFGEFIDLLYPYDEAGDLS